MNFKKLFTLALCACCLTFFVTGCGKQDKPDDNQDQPVDELADYKAYIRKDLNDAVKSIGELDPTVAAKVKAAHAAGDSTILAATTVKDIKAAYEQAKQAIAECVPYADGVYSFISASAEERTKILGTLEAYAIRNNMVGLSLFENGGYTMYHPRVTLGTEKYITGYGFGTLAEGAITADLPYETNAAYKRYYHTLNAKDPGTANALNSKGSEASDFYSYISASYFTTFMNETKDGYDWVPELAKSKIEAVDANEDGTSTKWRFEIRVGEELKYSTLSQKDDRKAFNNRPVAAEDYLTPYKLMYSQFNAMERGAEQANAKSGAIVGAKEYYAATKTITDGEKADFSTVGVKVYEENDKTYFEVEFTQPYNNFYSMYYISSNLYMPIPQEFLDLVKTTNVDKTGYEYTYLGYNKDRTYTPADNGLALGGYTLESWLPDQQVVYKKNPNYVYADTKYKIEGVHIRIYSAMETDNNAAFNEFIAEHTDAAGIPQTELAKYKNDNRTRQTTGDSVFKLNVNSLNQATWDKLFGENGTVAQTAPADRWVCEPALNNKHFVKALNLSINRTQYADARGSIPSVNYLSSNYMSDPVNGISYNTTKAHKDAVAGLLENTDNGFNLEQAREYFKIALAELEADGTYKPGTKDKPTVIELEIGWLYAQHETAYHNEIKQFFEDAFNDISVSGGKYKLEVKFWVGSQWTDNYYNKMLVGRYDLGFGSISGNSLDPLSFLNVLSTDPSINDNFCLNWAIDTNNPNEDMLVYKGVRWSYDALYRAATGQAIVSNGVNKPAFTTDMDEIVVAADGTASTTIEISLTLPEKTTLEVQDVVLCYYETDDYKEVSVGSENCVVTVKDGVVTIKVKVTKDLVEAYAGAMGFDVYYGISINGNESTGYTSFYGEFPKAK